VTARHGVMEAALDHGLCGLCVCVCGVRALCAVCARGCVTACRRSVAQTRQPVNERRNRQLSSWAAPCADWHGCRFLAASSDLAARRHPGGGLCLHLLAVAAPAHPRTPQSPASAPRTDDSVLARCRAWKAGRLCATNVPVDEKQKKWVAAYDQYSAFLWCAYLDLKNRLGRFQRASPGACRLAMQKNEMRQNADRCSGPLRRCECNTCRQELKLASGSFDKTHSVIVSCRWRDQVKRRQERGEREQERSKKPWPQGAGLYAARETPSKEATGRRRCDFGEGVNSASAA